jgi:H+/Cl- antiporter ClcA
VENFFWYDLVFVNIEGCMISALTVNLIYLGPQTGNGLLINDYGILTFGLSRRFLYRYPELLAFALLGVIGGILGAIFTKMNVWLNQWRRQYVSKWKLRQFGEVLLVTTVTACLAFGVSVLIPCRPVSSIQYFDNVCDNVKANSTIPETIFCSQVEISQNFLIEFVGHLLQRHG